MLPLFDDYCRLVADLPDQFACIKRSTLSVYTIGAFVAEVEGQLYFDYDYACKLYNYYIANSLLFRSKLKCGGFDGLNIINKILWMNRPT